MHETSRAGCRDEWLVFTEDKTDTLNGVPEKWTGLIAGLRVHPQHFAE